MFAPHNPWWLVIAVLICATIFAGQIVRRFAKPSSSQTSGRRRLTWLFWLAAVVLVGALFAIKGSDTRRLRAQLQAVVPSEVQLVTLTRGTLKRQLTDPGDIAQIIAPLQTLQPVSPHHSHPTDEVQVLFTFQGASHQYEVGRDSQRPDEYWVMVGADPAAGRGGYEIGRVRSANLASVLDRFLSRAR